MTFGAHVQSTGVDSGAGTAANLAFPSSNTAGNTLIVAARIGGTSQSPGISDSQGNTYAVTRSFEVDGDTVIVWHTTGGCAGGANTVTINNATSVTRRWAIHEYEGTAELDQTTHATGLGTNVDSGGVTTTTADELIFGAAKTNNTSEFTAGTDFTERQQVALRLSTEDRVVASTGTYSASFSLGTSRNWGCIIATFRQAAGGPSVTYPQLERRIRGLNRGLAA